MKIMFEDYQQLCLAIIIVVLLVLIVKNIFGQGFLPYTSGATQRYASEFSSTNQEPSIINRLAFENVSGENFTSGVNYDAHALLRESFKSNRNNHIAKGGNHDSNILGDNPKTSKLEKELFAKRMEESNFMLNM